MICKICGCENTDGSANCNVCGNALNSNNYKKASETKIVPKQKDKKIAPVIVICISAVAVLLIIAIIVNQLFIKNNVIQTKPYEYISAGCTFVAVNDDGSVSWINPSYTDDEGEYVQYKYDLSDWNNIKTVAVGSDWWVAGLKYDGTVAIETVSDKDDEEDYIKFRNEVSLWNDIVSISAGYAILAGLKADGTVVVASSYDYVLDACFDAVSQLSEVKQISVGNMNESSYLIALKNNGTVESIVHSCGSFSDDKTNEFFDNFYDLSMWKDIDYISTNNSGWNGSVFGVTKSGKVVSNYTTELIEDGLNLCIESAESSIGHNEAYNQLINTTVKMYDDMYKRIESLDVEQIVLSSDVFSYCDFDYRDALTIDNDDCLYLMLEDGTVVVESPMLSTYYACKNFSGDELYNKVCEYNTTIFEYDTFFDDWYEYYISCKKMINELSSYKNIIAIAYTNSYLISGILRDTLIALNADGTVCTNKESAEVNDWSGIKTSEKNKSIEMGRTIDKTESNRTTTTKSISTTETTKKKKTSTTKPTTTKKFYEGKYYLYADESGELNIYVLQFYGDTVKMTAYDNVDDHPTVAFTDTYKLSWNKAHDYAEINDEIIFIFDDKYKVILYQTANMAKHAALIEYDKVGVSDIIDFASDYL